MSKNIVFPYMTFNRFFDEPIIKKLALFYEQIYIQDGGFSVLDRINEENAKEEDAPLMYEKAVWRFLADHGVLKTYPYQHSKFDDPGEEAKALKEQLNDLWEKERTPGNWPKNPNDEQKMEMKKAYFDHMFLWHDLSIRLDTLQLRKQDEFKEYYPLLRSGDTLRTNNKKDQVIQFLLKDIPEPDHSVSWDQVIEYRSDDDVRNKYLALLNWINRTANSNQRLSEIKEEYDYLYNEYKRQFALHKLKHSYSMLEVVVSAGVNFMGGVATGNLIPTLKDLFQLKVKNAGLMQEESKIPGKEIAYIFHTKNSFEAT